MSVIKYCKICNKPFEVTTNQKCCSDECKRIKHNQRNKKYRDNNPKHWLKHDYKAHNNKYYQSHKDKVKSRIKNNYEALKKPKYCIICGKELNVITNKKYCNDVCKNIAKQNKSK